MSGSSCEFWKAGSVYKSGAHTKQRKQFQRNSPDSGDRGVHRKQLRWRKDARDWQFGQYRRHSNGRRGHRRLTRRPLRHGDGGRHGFRLRRRGRRTFHHNVRMIYNVWRRRVSAISVSTVWFLRLGRFGVLSRRVTLGFGGFPKPLFARERGYWLFEFFWSKKKKDWQYNTMPRSVRVRQRLDVLMYRNSGCAVNAAFFNYGSL